MQTHLNDDCLLHIFEMLEIPDHLCLIETCERFRTLIIDVLWRRKYRDIHTQMQCFQSLELDEYKKFFQLNAKNIRTLNIGDTKHFAFTSYLNRFTQRPDFSFYFSLDLSNLKELHCQDQRLHDGYIQMLSKYSPNLELLHMKSQHVTDEFFGRFPKLRNANTAINI